MVTYDHHSRKLLRWYASSCPCCRRPLDITVRSRPNESELDESQWRGQAFTAVSNYEILVMIVLFWCFIVLVFFFTGIIRSPYSSPMSHCYCEIAGIFDQIIIFPCLISVFGTKKVIHRAAGAKSRSGRLGFDFPSSLRSLRLHLCDVGH